MTASNGSIIIRVDGDPKPQPRARAVKIGDHARVYNPPTNASWRECVALAGKQARPVKPLDGPLRVDTVFIFRRPKGHFSTGAKGGLVRSAPVYWHTAARGPYGGDRDNLDKTILDVLTQCGLWVDDGLVCSGQILKRWQGDRRERPGALIVVTPLLDMMADGWLTDLDVEMRHMGDEPAPKAKVRQVAPAQTPGPSQAIFIAAFSEAWAARYGTKYPFQGGKDAAAAKFIWESISGDMGKGHALIGAYMAERDKFYEGHRLAMLRMDLAKFLAKLQGGGGGMTRDERAKRIAALAKKKDADHG